MKSIHLFNYIVKVLKRLGLQLSKSDIESAVNCSPEAIEKILKIVKLRVENYTEKARSQDLNNYSPLQPKKSNTNPYNIIYENPSESSPPKNEISNSLYEKDQAINDLRETIEV